LTYAQYRVQRPDPKLLGRPAPLRLALTSVNYARLTTITRIITITIIIIIIIVITVVVVVFTIIVGRRRLVRFGVFWVHGEPGPTRVATVLFRAK